MATRPHLSTLPGDNPAPSSNAQPHPSPHNGPRSGVRDQSFYTGFFKAAPDGAAPTLYPCSRRRSRGAVRPPGRSPRGARLRGMPADRQLPVEAAPRDASSLTLSKYRACVLRRFASELEERTTTSTFLSVLWDSSASSLARVAAPAEEPTDRTSRVRPELRLNTIRKRLMILTILRNL